MCRNWSNWQVYSMETCNKVKIEYYELVQKSFIVSATGSQNLGLAEAEDEDLLWKQE